MSNNEIEVELAKPSARIIAYLINTIITFCLAFISAFLVVAALNTESSDSGTITLGIALLVLLVYTFVQCFFMSRDGQSIGKKIMGIKVIRSNGEKAGFVYNVLLREGAFNLILVIIGFIFAIAFSSENASNIPAVIASLICLVMIFKAEDSRTLQDKLADTLVVQLPKKR